MQTIILQDVWYNVQLEHIICRGLLQIVQRDAQITIMQIQLTENVLLEEHVHHLLLHTSQMIQQIFVYLSAPLTILPTRRQEDALFTVHQDFMVMTQVE